MRRQSSGRKQFAVCYQLLLTLSYRVRECDGRGGRGEATFCEARMGSNVGLLCRFMDFVQNYFD
jgi:hypothetical protein